MNLPVRELAPYIEAPEYPVLCVDCGELPDTSREPGDRCMGCECFEMFQRCESRLTSKEELERCRDRMAEYFKVRLEAEFGRAACQHSQCPRERCVAKVGGVR